MKHAKRIALATLVAGLVGGLAATVVGAPVAAEAPSAEAAPDSLETQTLTVEGWHCDGCTEATVEQVEALDGVVSVEGDFDAGTLTVAFDATAIGVESVCEIVEGSGYTCE